MMGEPATWVGYVDIHSIISAFHTDNHLTQDLTPLEVKAAGIAIADIICPLAQQSGDRMVALLLARMRHTTSMKTLNCCLRDIYVWADRERILLGPQDDTV